MNSSKEFSKVNRSKQTTTVVAPKRFRSAFDEGIYQTSVVLCYFMLYPVEHCSLRIPFRCNFLCNVLVELELNNLKERNGQISNKKSMKNTQPIKLAAASFNPAAVTATATHTLGDSSIIPPSQSALPSQSQKVTASQPDTSSIGKVSNAFDALTEPETVNFQFALKPSLLTSLTRN